MVDEHGLWLAADFLTEYGVRLADVLFEWPPREVLALVEALPPEARLWAHVAGGERWREFHGWGQDRQLFANLWDLTAAHAMAGTKKKPPTYPRPEDKKTQAGMPLMAMFPRKQPKGDT